MFLLFFVICLPLMVCGYWGQGHMLIATLAENQLKYNAKQFPNGNATLERVKAMLGDMEPYFTEDSSYIFSADWPDNIINRNGILAFSSWHYLNLGYTLNGSGIVPPLADTDPPNVAWALQTVRDGIAAWPKTGHMFQPVYTALLIHLVGDAHEPMHCISFYSKKFPNEGGDRGGNLCEIQLPASATAHEKDQVKNLHALWDSVGLLYPEDPFFTTGKAPNASWVAKLRRQAVELHSLHPPESFGESELNNLDFEAWVKHGYDLAVSQAYENDPFRICNLTHPLTEQYIANVGLVAQKQVALAGYRLARLLYQTTPADYKPLYPYHPLPVMIGVAAGVLFLGSSLGALFLWCFMVWRTKSKRQQQFNRLAADETTPLYGESAAPKAISNDFYRP